MNRIIVFIFLVSTITITFSQGKTGNKESAPYLQDYNKYDAIYRAAEALSLRPDYNEETEMQESQMNKLALQGFSAILPAIEKAGDDSLAFHCLFKIGTLQHYFDSLITEAQQSYQKAIACRLRLPQMADSFFFKAYIYSGGIYYTMNQYDSALSSYKKAEEIADNYQSSLNGANRLFNTLGAMYYETGNYTQAKNYFEKAIAVLSPNEFSYKDLLINYKINLASTLTRLEEFEGAGSIYQEILPFNINRNEILHNIGAVRMNQGLFNEAISYFRQVQYNNNKIIRLYNDIGSAWLELRKSDSARHWLEKALSENGKWNGERKNTPHGLTFKHIGDLFVQKGQYMDAVEKYQQAIMQFDKDFNEKEAGKNPESFVVVFSYIQLFNTLIAKADGLALLYNQQREVKLLESSLKAYHSAFSLAGYVEKTYDSDEARLFLNKIKYTVHSKPIEVSLQLFDLTHKKEYLEEAYFYDQQNKASVLSLNVQENELRNSAGAGNELFRQEYSLKAAITRLSLKAQQTIDSSALQQINASIRDYKIQLGKIQEKINDNPAHKEKRLTERIPLIGDVQKSLDNRSALLSYHLSEKELIIFFISAKKSEYTRVSINRLFFEQIDSFKVSLSKTSDEQRYNGMTLAMSLYQELMAPVLAKLTNIDRLIIIPDDELNYLPFEALQNENHEYLVENFSIQYQYSTTLFGKAHSSHIAANILAFAPFASKEYADSNGFILTNLPASKEEINNLDGKLFIDHTATKQSFIQNANRYGIIHLATHANVNNETPLRSYIAFYPDTITGEFRLYAGEIYNMNLDSTRLVILSACETGTGKLIKGEGLMSLSRAFTYAGCPNIITSLWKAEDKTTAFISQQLHHYLDKGYSHDKALQQAKLDLLRNTEVDPRLKTPNCWGHLIFIGQYEKTKSPLYRWWKEAAIIVVSIILIYLLKKNPSRKNRDGNGPQRKTNAAIDEV